MKSRVSKLIRTKYKYDVLFWAALHPLKLGSFEDYMCHLAYDCYREGIRILFVFGDRISETMVQQFRKFKVNYCALQDSDLTSSTAMMNIVSKNRPRLIHFNFISYCGFVPPACRLLGVKKLIFTEHSSVMAEAPTTGLMNRIKRFRRHFLSSNVNKFIAVSRFIANDLEKESSIPSRKIDVIYNGVDTDRFSPSDSHEKAMLKRHLFNIDASQFVITFVGQLIKEKGFLVFIDAAKILMKQRNDTLFILVGENKDIADFADLIVNKYNRIRFVGNRDNVEEFLKASDILVVPSLWQEAFGLVIAEGMACGTPVIASRVGAIPEIISHLDNGIMVSPGDSNELALSIDELLTNKVMRDKISRACRLRVEKCFDLEMMVTKTRLLYQTDLAT